MTVPFKTHAELPARVLRIVNRFRVKMGESALSELPRGKRDLATGCPIANALNGGSYNVWSSRILCPTVASAQALARVTRGGAMTWPSGSRVELPDHSALSEFVRRFDAGEYPEYEA